MEPAEVVRAFYAALRDRRTADVLALVDLDVACWPLVRPGRTLYEGRASMVALDRDMHARYGSYSIQLGTMTMEPGPAVTAQAVILPEPSLDISPQHVTTRFGFRGDLIATIESSPTEVPDGAGS